MGPNPIRSLDLRNVRGRSIPNNLKYVLDLRISRSQFRGRGVDKSASLELP
jgi:hypothetical protein